MTAVTTWLREQIDWTRRVAAAATPGPWRHDPAKPWTRPGTTEPEEAVFAGPPGKRAACVAGTGASDDQQSMLDARHIALHDPTAALALCDSQTAILDWIEENTTSDLKLTSPDQDADEFLGSLFLSLRTRGLLDALLLAYRHRPGYDEVAAAHAAEPTEVHLSISDDELTARRDLHRKAGEP